MFANIVVYAVEFQVCHHKGSKYLYYPLGTMTSLHYES